MNHRTHTRTKFTLTLSALLLCSICTMPSLSYGQKRLNLPLAPPSFVLDGKKIVPMDIQTSYLKLTLDIASQRAFGTSTITFKTGEAGFPSFDLISPKAIAKLNQQVVPIPEITDPDRDTVFRVVGAPVTAGSLNQLEITYDLDSDAVTFSQTGVRLGFFMNDVDARQGRGFLEQYAPANFEFDQYKMVLDLQITGTQAPHQIFTNGALKPFQKNQWRIEFPEYFTSSSMYMHVTDRPMQVATGIFSGMQAKVPVTVYSEDQRLAHQGLQQSIKVLAENEATFGPFAHSSLTVYVTPNGGGMEYCGATQTSLWALSHELTHSWFARGVMPANGNAGWIDEAIASWHDDGYPRSSIDPTGSAVNLAHFPPYHRATPLAAYTSGKNFLAQLDHLFSEKTGGLRPVLKKLYAEGKRSVITTPIFKNYLEAQTGINLKAAFAKFVYGGGQKGPHYPDPTSGPQNSRRYPRPPTHAEIVRMR